MQKIINLTGSYKFHKNGTHFYIEDNEFYIGERKEATLRKPKYYIVQIKPKRSYISSLFPEGICPQGELYRMDYVGCHYKVILTPTEVKLKSVGSRWIA